MVLLFAVSVVLYAFGYWSGFRAAMKPRTPKRDKKDPCGDYHDFVVIDAQPLRGPALSYEHTAVLRRCTRCKQHLSVNYAGAWTLDHFLKTQPDPSVSTDDLRR